MLESFPIFYIACRTCIEVVVWKLQQLSESWGYRKCQKGHCLISGLGRDREFSVAIEFLWPCVATWSLGWAHGDSALARTRPNLGEHNKHAHATGMRAR